MSPPVLFSLPSGRGRTGAFTLVETLVAMAVTILIVTVMVGVLTTTLAVWKRTSSKIESFASVHDAFERISRLLEQAVLATYWDYDNVNNPSNYFRASELQYFSGPMAKMGFDPVDYPSMGVLFFAPTAATNNFQKFGALPDSLNAYGFFISYGDDTASLPSFFPPPSSPNYRFRLKEWRQATENIGIYRKTSGTAGAGYLGNSTLGWTSINSSDPVTIAEDVVALIISPEDENGPITDDYVYNSRNDLPGGIGLLQRHQLPPVVEVVMIAIAAEDARRICANKPSPPDLIPGDLFQNPLQLNDDLDKVRQHLDSQRIAHIVLRSKIQLRSGQWSESPATP